MTTNSWAVDANGDWATAANWSRNAIPVSSDDVTISTADIRTITHGSGSDTVHSLTVGNDHFVLNGGSLEILSSASFALDFTQTGGSLLGAATIGVNGNGTLTGGYAGGTTAFRIGGTIALANYTLGGSTTLVNNATTNQTGQITLGDNTGFNATITNSSGAIYRLTTDDGIGGGATSATFSNAGILRKAAGSGTSTIGVNVTSTGTIAVATGTLNFTGASNSFGGTIGGPGIFEVSGGASTIASGTTLSVSGITLAGNSTTVTLGGSFTYAGTYNQFQGSTLALGGNTLTLTGTANFNNNGTFGPTVNGSGTLATSGTVSVNNLTQGGSVIWQNTGIVNLTGGLQIGDASGSLIRFANGTGGLFNITNDSGIGVGSNASSNFNNNGGTLAKTGGSGTSTVSASFQNGSGRASAIQIGGGTLNFVGATSSFVNQAISGAGTFQIGGGAASISGGTTIAAANWLISGNSTTVAMAQDVTYAGSYSQVQGSTVNLGGTTLTLNGAVNLNNNGTFQPSMAGSGTLATAGTVLMNNFILGGAVIWRNTGTINATGNLQIGDGSGNLIRLANATYATYNLTNDSGISAGSNVSSNFNNNGGTLAKTGGSGTSTISASFQNGSSKTGAVAINTGTIDFVGATSNFNQQAISGAGTLQLGGGSATMGPGTTVSTANWLISGNSTTVTLAQNLTYANAYTQTQGSTVNLAGNTLALTGAVTLTNAGTFSPSFTGSGTLATSGTVSLNSVILGGTVNWTSTGTVNSTASMQIGDSSASTASFTNAAGANFKLVNDGGIASGAASTSVFNNGGTLIKTGGTGNSYVGTKLVNTVGGTGTVEVTTGSMEFGNTVSGSQNVNADAGTRLIFDTNVDSGVAVKFNGANSSVWLNNAPTFNGSLSNFGAGKSLDLRSVYYNNSTTFGYSGNVLTVSDGVHTANLTMVGSYNAGSFHIGSDTANGTMVTYG